MPGEIEKYIEALQIAETRDADVASAISRLTAAANHLTDRHRGWKSLLLPSMRNMSLERGRGLSQTHMQPWPSQEEVYEKITAYWEAISACDAAYSLIPPALRSGVKPPPDHIERR